MISIKPKSFFTKRSPTPISEVTIDDMMTVPFTEYTTPVSFGHQFNLVRAVKEYAPIRLDTIQKETIKLKEQLHSLDVEAKNLQALLRVLQQQQQKKKVNQPTRV